MPLAKLKIRDCGKRDVASVQEIENASFEDPYPPSLFRSFLSNFPQGFRIAMLGELLVGYSILVQRGRKALIASLAVKPEYRSQGVGSELLQDAINLCKMQLKANSIELQVRENNSDAISLYLKFGFARKGKIRNYYGRGKDGLLMSLEFAQT